MTKFTNNVLLTLNCLQQGSPFLKKKQRKVSSDGVCCVWGPMLSYESSHGNWEFHAKREQELLNFQTTQAHFGKGRKDETTREIKVLELKCVKKKKL